jgi:hypothetical protein
VNESIPPSEISVAEKAPFRLVVFWKEDPRTKKAFLQYREVQILDRMQTGGGEEEPAYDFYPLVLTRLLDRLLAQWKTQSSLAEALKSREAALDEAAEYFNQALGASDNPHCETFVTQTAMNFMMTVDLLFNIVYFPESLPLLFEQTTLARMQQTGALYIWLDPYLGGLSRREHKPLDTDEANWPAKEEFYCYFRRKSDPSVSPQQVANIWRTTATQIMEIEEDCRGRLWGWLKGQRFSEEEIRALILP